MSSEPPPAEPSEAVEAARPSASSRTTASSPPPHPWLIENNVFKQDWRAQGRGHIMRYFVLKWVLCFLVGALTAAVASLPTSASRTSPTPSLSSPPTACSRAVHVTYCNVA
ncbi:hypothetical protein ZWY2020_041241 [Hordeum vulgare]|nr:hypothetical protein ZWY2020_041241 [Hordeum vulgare]